jgi:TetR/AcrR family transcriptional regulator
MKTRIQARNEERILDAAQEVFATYGYHGATIDEIAGRAGISKPNLHYYFKRKRDLYLAVLRRTLEIWLVPLRELDRAGDPAVEIGNYIAQKVQLSRRFPAASRVFANEILQGAPFLKRYLRTNLREVVKRKAAVIRHWIDQGKLAPIDPYHLIFLIWAATQHYADFIPQIKAVMDVPRLTQRHFRKVEQSLSRIILHGVLADKARGARRRRLPKAE